MMVEGLSRCELGLKRELFNPRCEECILTQIIVVLIQTLLLTPFGGKVEHCTETVLFIYEIINGLNPLKSTITDLETGISCMDILLC